MTKGVGVKQFRLVSTPGWWFTAGIPVYIKQGSRSLINKVYKPSLYFADFIRYIKGLSAFQTFFAGLYYEPVVCKVVCCYSLNGYMFSYIGIELFGVRGQQVAAVKRETRQCGLQGLFHVCRRIISLLHCIRF